MVARRSRSLVILGAALLALVIPAPVASAEGPTDPAPPPTIAVQVDPGTSIEPLATAQGLQVRAVVPGSLATYLVAPRTALDPTALGTLLTRLRSAKGVAVAEVDQPMRLSGQRFHAWPDGLPGDATTAADFDAQFATDGLSLDAVHLRSTGAGVRVAVLDTGADLTHPVLQGRVVPRWNYVDGTADVTESADATGAAVGHGTFVAGLIAKVAPGAQLYVYKVLDADGWGTSVMVAQAVRDAIAAKVNVISMSLSSPDHADSKLVRDAIAAARTAGIVVVAAAGNCDPPGTATVTPAGPAPSPDSCNPTEPQFPADVASVLSVGALEVDGRSLASFSGRGPWVKLAAPGVAVTGPLPGNRYATWDGTSMSTALVAGQVAAVTGSPTLSLLRALPQSRYLLVTNAVTTTALALPQRPVAYGSVQMVRSLDCIGRILC